MKSLKRKTNFVSWLTIVGLVVSFIGLPTQANAATVYKYEWMAQSGNVSKDGLAHEYNNLQPGQTITLSLTMINRSGNTIRARHRLAQSPDKQVPVGSWGIGTQNPQDGTPSFLDSSSFFLNNNRFTYYEGDDVENNRMINFSWTIKLKSNLANGTYYLYLRPVCEYLAWTRQVKNGITLPGTDSDIYWKFRVGGGDDSDVPTEYVRYVNPRYGFSFVYKKPIYPEVLSVSEKNGRVEGDMTDDVLNARIGIPDTGAIHTSLFVARNDTVQRISDFLESRFIGDGLDYTKQNLQLNGINWTVFRYHEDYANSNRDVRIGQLPNGYVLRVYTSGLFNSEPDQTFLNSIKLIDVNVYVNNQFGFRLNIPDGYKAVVHSNPQYAVFTMGIDLETSTDPSGYEDDILISITPCSLNSDPGGCLLGPETPEGFEDIWPKFMGYITIGGKKAVWYDGTTGGSYYRYYVFNGNNYKFEFTALPNSTVLSSILSSFQFI